MASTATGNASVISQEEMLEHWQGHRRLTRKLIEVYPEDQLFTYSIGGMRPFAQLVLEMLGMGIPGVQGLATGDWKMAADMPELASWKNAPTSKKELLERWDQTTEEINKIWPTIPADRFPEQDKAFGMYEGTVTSFVFYFIDNEIHHRGQAYVYLRSLGVEPPAFWDRS
jgi:uncharacterized damage-inducible protein DinB